MRSSLVLFTLLAFPATVSAQDVVAPCVGPSADRTAAEAALVAFDRSVEQAAPTDDLTPLLEEYRRLLDQRCFRILEEVPVPTPASVVSLKDWWARGGESWFQYAVVDDRTLTVPPQPIPALTLETAARTDPLRRLLCRGEDARCGAATRGWRMRAENAFRAHALREATREPSPEREEGRFAQCVQRAGQAEEPLRYLTWSRCVESSIRPTAALPLGAFQPPTDGWLVIRGRRGHYSYCEEVRAYDLATGAAYLARECGQLFRGIGQTTSAPDVAGRVPVDAIREAVWILLLAERVSDVRTQLRRVPLAEGLRRGIPASGGLGMGRGWGSWATSGQTRLSWSWVEGATVRASGAVTWPDSARASEDHADDLLRIAEAAFDDTCAPAALPRQLALDHDRSGVSAVDAAPAARAQTQSSLSSRLRALRPRRCR